jgi:hypothetical protein
VAKLPKAHEAIVAREKIVDYLLSTTHKDGAPKAAYFAALGFDASNPDGFKEAIIKHAVEGQVTSQVTSEFGEKYIVEGPMSGPAGTSSGIKSVWQRDTDESPPRLVTAYPLRKAG